jgi:hypothetical protein
MANINEGAEAYEFLYTKLHGDATLLSYATGDVWPDMAPPGTATPFVVLTLQSETDTLTMNVFRILSRPLFQVKATGPATQRVALRNAANRIDTLLGRTNGTTTNAIIESCWRDGVFNLPEIVDGALWTSIGGFYRLDIAS